MTTIRSIIPLVMALLSVGSGASANIVEMTKDRGVAVTPVQRHDDKCTWGAHNGHEFTTQTVNMSTGKTTYGLTYTACIDKAHGDRAGWIEGYLGMPSPTSCNWYHGGFIFLSVNGEDVGTYRPLYYGPSESGKRGAVDIVWSLPSTLLRVRFITLPDDDALLMELRLEPKQPIANLNLRLNCYPGAFTSWEKIKGDRTITTPTREEHQNPWLPNTEKTPEVRSVTLDPKEDWWVFYSDTVCDIARGVGAGPCAMLFLPGEMQAESVTLTDYPVGTGLTANPEATSLRMIFWDFQGKTNADALIYLKENAERHRQLLEKFDFTSGTVRDLLAGKRQVELAGLLQATQSLSVDRTAATNWLDQLNQAVNHARQSQKGKGGVSIEDENEILQLLTREDDIAEPLRWKALFPE